MYKYTANAPFYGGVSLLRPSRIEKLSSPVGMEWPAWLCSPAGVLCGSVVFGWVLVLQCLYALHACGVWSVSGAAADEEHVRNPQDGEQTVHDSGKPRLLSASSSSFCSSVVKRPRLSTNSHRNVPYEAHSAASAFWLVNLWHHSQYSNMHSYHIYIFYWKYEELHYIVTILWKYSLALLLNLE